MQDKNNKYYNQFNLAELYSNDDLNKLFKIIPELSNLIPLNKNSIGESYSEKKSSLNENSENINIIGKSLKINKFHFFKIILSKLKSYFEINESFIIMKTISIIINEIKSLEKHFTLNEYSSTIKSKSKSKSKIDKKIENENKSLKKSEKIPQDNQKFPNTITKIKLKNNGINNTNSNFNKNLKKKVYFRTNNNQLKKENKTEIIFSKLNYENKNRIRNKKHINLNLNETERKISHIDLSLLDLKKYEFQKFQKQNIISNNHNNSSEFDLNFYLDSENNVKSHNFSTNFDNKNYFTSIENKRDLYNNNNNLYINIYEQKKINCNSSENASVYLQNQIQDKGDIKKENIRNNFNINLSLINDIETENFNIFELDKKSSGKSLLLIGCYIFNRFGFHNIIKYLNFENWLSKIAGGYSRKNPYHTDIHAGDITQTCLTFFKIGKINEICKLNQLSKCSLFLSCICHDYKHPGVNNNFLKDTRNILAIKYNDNSILENMHISEAFKLTIDFPNCDIFSGMNSDKYKQMRKEMISCVLFTDMTKHKMTLEFMNEIEKNSSNNNSNKEKKEDNDVHQNFMNLLIHSADISNPTKKFDIYWKWAEVVVEEFFQQGDKEKELGLKCSFDRETTTIYQNQLGFINYIELPFYTSFIRIFSKLKYLLDNLNYNKNEILALQEKNKEKEKKKDNINIIKK